MEISIGNNAHRESILHSSNPSLLESYFALALRGLTESDLSSWKSHVLEFLLLMILAMEVVASAAEVCVGITQMLQKSISRFLTPRITLSIALLRLAIYEVFHFKQNNFKNSFDWMLKINVFSFEWYHWTLMYSNYV